MPKNTYTHTLHTLHSIHCCSVFINMQFIEFSLLHTICAVCMCDTEIVLIRCGVWYAYTQHTTNACIRMSIDNALPSVHNTMTYEHWTQRSQFSILLAHLPDSQSARAIVFWPFWRNHMNNKGARSSSAFFFLSSPVCCSCVLVCMQYVHHLVGMFNVFLSNKIKCVWSVCCAIRNRTKWTFCCVCPGDTLCVTLWMYISWYDDSYTHMHNMILIVL